MWSTLSASEWRCDERLGSMVVPAGRPKLTHYLPSIRPSRFATLGLHKLCVCVRVCLSLCLHPAEFIMQTAEEFSTKKISLTDHLDIIGQAVSSAVCFYVCVLHKQGNTKILK